MSKAGRRSRRIASLFGVTLRTLQRWWRAWRTDGRDAPKPRPGRPRIFVGSVAEQLRREVSHQPDATLYELAERVGGIAHYATVHRALERLELPFKKRRSGPPSKTDPT